MKRKLLILLFITLSFSIVGCGKKNKDGNETVNKTQEGTGIKENKNEGVIIDQVVDTFKVTDITLKYVTDSKSYIEAKVTNTGDKKHVEYFNLTVKDKENNVLATMIWYIGGDIAKDEEKSVRAETDVDLSKADSLEIKLS